jgi:hypothetical protein
LTNGAGGPTNATCTDIADHVKAFFAAGGEFKFPPHTPALLESWLDTARRALNDFYSGPSEKRTARLRQGLLLMWGAIESENCIGAVLRGELAAAVGYRRTVGALDHVILGSRQAVPGAGMALSLALANQAVRFDLPVRAIYMADARRYHERLGRRLDDPSRFDSRWTLDDCRFIVRNVGDQL